MEQETASLPTKGVLCVMSMCIRISKCMVMCQNNLHDDSLVSLPFISNTPNNQERMRINTSAGDGVFGSDLEKMWQD